MQEGITYSLDTFYIGEGVRILIAIVFSYMYLVFCGSTSYWHPGPGKTKSPNSVSNNILELFAWKMSVEGLNFFRLFSRQESSMIHSAWPTVSPVVNFALFSLEICFVLPDFEKWRRTYGRTTYAKIIITTSRNCGLVEWINLMSGPGWTVIFPREKGGKN